MKQFKALFKKEALTHRGSLLAPVWVTLGFYAVALLGVVINLIKSGSISIVSGEIPVMLQSQLDLISWQASAGLTSLLGMIAMFVGFGISDGMLNGDRRKRCEIFHLSQPVSLLKALSAKFSALYGVSMLILLALTLVNSLAISVIMNLTIGSGLWSGLAGGMTAYVAVLFSYLFGVALTWLFASVFKHKSFLIGFLVISGIEISIQLLNFLVGWNIPSLGLYVLKLLRLSVFTVRVGDQTVQSANLIPEGVDLFMNWNNLLRVLYAAIMLCVSWFFLRKREVA